MLKRWGLYEKNVITVNTAVQEWMVKAMDNDTCKYCHVDFDSYVKALDKNGHVFIDRPDYKPELNVIYYGHWIEIPICYCPMCGRMLGKGINDGR